MVMGDNDERELGNLQARVGSLEDRDKSQTQTVREIFSALKTLTANQSEIAAAQQRTEAVVQQTSEQVAKFLDIVMPLNGEVVALKERTKRVEDETSTEEIKKKVKLSLSQTPMPHEPHPFNRKRSQGPLEPIKLDTKKSIFQMTVSELAGLVSGKAIVLIGTAIATIVFLKVLGWMPASVEKAAQQTLTEVSE